MKHTPGPWDKIVHGRSDSRVGAKTLIAIVYSQAYGDRENQEANARLIAAAPELLAELKEAVKDCRCSLAERDSGHRIDCFAPGALAAIAKAEMRDAI
jgi:hypothetical protein